MILIFGGSYQGKLDFARKTFNIDDQDIFICSEEAMIDYSKKVIDGMEKLFLGMIKNDVSVTDFLMSHRADLKDKIIIINDISQGIVPVDKTLRAWREATGRAMMYLAEEADEVYRVFCGIGQKIK